jgi:hypothetical protein
LDGQHGMLDGQRGIFTWIKLSYQAVNTKIKNASVA